MNVFILAVLSSFLLVAPAETLVFRNGTKLEVTKLEIREESVSYVYGGLTVSMPIQSVDIEATRKLMAEKETLRKQKEEEHLQSEKKEKSEKEEKDKVTQATTSTESREKGATCSEQAREMLKNFQKRYQGGTKTVQGSTLPPSSERSFSQPLSGMYSIPFVRENGLMLVEVSLNGNPRVQFILDTGASATTVGKDFAYRNGVKIDFSTSGVVGTAGGESTVYLGFVSTLQVGQLTIENFPVLVSPACRYNLLGSDFLEPFNYSIDNLRNTVILTPNRGW